MTESTANQGLLSHFSSFRWISGLQEDYHSIFVEEWSPYLGAVLVVIVASALMASGAFWGVFGGLKLWGDYFNNFIGLGSLLDIKEKLPNPLNHYISIMDMTLLLGAFCAALLSRQFKISRPPVIEYFWGALGGTFMGMGAALAGGCTTGGFFTPLTFASPAGWAMWVGLLGGAFLGLKALLWTMENVTWGSVAPARGPESPLKKIYPVFGFAVLGLVILWASRWVDSENAKTASLGIAVLAGFALGFILHRSRFCFSRVFREPFMTGEGTMTKAMILALAIGIPIGSLLMQKGVIKDPYIAIPPMFWLGSMLGGLIFGFGMVFAGGCASGSLWRMGEGHLKLWVAVFFFGWTGSTFSAIVNRWDLLVREDNLENFTQFTKMGYQAHLPEMLNGWQGVYLLSFGILLAWYLLVRYNESTERFTVL